MANPARDTNYESTPGGNTGGTTSNRKLKGATEVIHGIGENIRGRFMDAVDSSTKTGGGHPETYQGRREVEEGMAKLTGGPGVGGGAPRSDTHPTHGAGGAPHSASDRDGGYGRGQLGQEGNALGPTSAMTTGFGNAGPEVAVAEAPYQQQYSAGGAGAPGAGGAVREQGNDRDFGYAHAQRNEMPSAGQQGSTSGPAPDRYSLGGEGPRQLP
ncbi:hypothetical protein C8T65DRAFT_761399 [Cerioporus squamosus]|nr:hypothetical protein C8T65DRAFT_761399 [Cerioporus squamosus]